MTTLQEKVNDVFFVSVYFSISFCQNYEIVKIKKEPCAADMLHILTVYLLSSSSPFLFVLFCHFREYTENSHTQLCVSRFSEHVDNSETLFTHRRPNCDEKVGPSSGSRSKRGIIMSSANR